MVHRHPFIFARYSQYTEIYKDAHKIAHFVTWSLQLELYTQSSFDMFNKCIFAIPLALIAITQQALPPPNNPLLPHYHPYFNKPRMLQLQRLAYLKSLYDAERSLFRNLLSNDIDLLNNEETDVSSLRSNLPFYQVNERVILSTLI